MEASEKKQLNSEKSIKFKVIMIIYYCLFILSYKK